jgi:predicted nucleic acid-binding Zn ribbon protein
MSEQTSNISVYDLNDMERDTTPPAPISPRTVANVLGPAPDADAQTLRALVDGLLATIKKREFEHELQQNQAVTQVKALERQPRAP